MAVPVTVEVPVEVEVVAEPPATPSRPARIAAAADGRPSPDHMPVIQHIDQNARRNLGNASLSQLMRLASPNAAKTGGGMGGAEFASAAAPAEDSPVVTVACAADLLHTARCPRVTATRGQPSLT